MEHVGDSAARSHGIHRDLLFATVLGEDAHKGVDGALGPRVERVRRHAEVLCRVRRHQDNTPALVEVAIGFTSDKELTARVQAEDAVELLLFGLILIISIRSYV